ncbi:uncharacterized protein LTR77_005518 [Saxophila tyrrhenica]|uniref:Uncharacterized protein n=1 Tax=Saxophila tyrrhenica TaxID=1690608 RepID=A0AAV9P9B1_9PEZI|nr:hypothetical protein LTR77_005518 [Saxophila tyrrhenica]
MATSSETPLRRKRGVTNFVRLSKMKSFLNRKKTPTEPLSATEEAFQALSSPPPPPPVSPGLKKTQSRWKRSKKQVEVAPEVNIAQVLPPTDDFRTSLLMPTFAARFSMLREQDDPNSLLGKASDDSVLQPRRRSRMDFGGLGDIAEVSSIKSQVRPPFAYGRQDSFASEDGYASENDSHNGSVLSRARPGEGNTMFGGRQKVYMIPKAGASASSRSLGKVRYEDDIGMSAFQRYKRELEQQAIQARTSDEGHSFDFGLDRMEHGEDYGSHSNAPNDSAKDLSHSPSLSSYDKKRSTSSSSHSEARSSTIATSVASQPGSNLVTAPAQTTAPTPSAPPALKRADTKTRRLYEQGLDQHMYEQQASAMTRLNSIHRQRGMGVGKPSPPVLHSTRSAGNLNEKARQPVYAVRPQSPEALLTNFGSIRKQQPSNTSSPNLSGPVSPLTPHFEGGSDMALTQALEPGDRGKATAMGAFNKPKQSFDENQYLERQRQLQRSASNAAVKKPAVTPSAVQQRMDRFDLERQRSDSDLSARSRSRPAAPVSETSSAYNVFQRAAQMNTTTGAQQFDKSTLPDTHRTFFGNISASDSEDEEDSVPRYPQQSPYAQQDYGYGGHHGRWQPTALPSVSEHPALRSKKSKASLAEEDEDAEMMNMDTNHNSDFRLPEHPAFRNPEPDVDSPTLGPGAGSTPLTGMMHHLRQQSNVSSITQGEDKRSLDESHEMPELPEEWAPKDLDLIHRPIQPPGDSDSRVGSAYTSSNPFDLEERDNPSRTGERVSRVSISPVEGHRPYNNIDSRGPSRAGVLSRQSEVSQLEPEAEEGSSWQNELQRQHTRDASNATQLERDAFQEELEARKLAAQEKIQQAISKSRSASPAPSASDRPGFRGFGMLRSRPSGESVAENAQRQQAPPKAMKMLGLSGGASSTTLNSQYERSGYSLDINRQRDMSATRPPLPDNPPRAMQQAGLDARREWQARSRENSVTQGRPPSGRSPASSAGARSRANSEAAGGRSRSRTGPYRDDLEKAMMEDTGSSAAGVPEVTPMIPQELTPRPSPDVPQGAFEQGRARSNSRPPVPGYFDSKNLQPHLSGSRERLSPGVPPPVTLSPNVYFPGPPSGRPAPPSPFSSHMTPPLSGANTPVSSTFTPPTPAPPSSGSNRPNIPLRKKTISKGDISEPTLITSTSNFDTVDLPEGASLKNGMEEPPPLPPINPRRRATKAMFGLVSRKDSEDSTLTFGARSKTPDPWVGTRPVESEYQFEPPMLANRSGSDGRSPRMPATKQSFDQSASMRQNGFAPNAGSPERMDRPPVPTQPAAAAYEGGMF